MTVTGAWIVLVPTGVYVGVYVDVGDCTGEFTTPDVCVADGIGARVGVLLGSGCNVFVLVAVGVVVGVSVINGTTEVGSTGCRGIIPDLNQPCTPANTIIPRKSKLKNRNQPFENLFVADLSLSLSKEGISASCIG